jgi:hypothetical protein
VVRPIGGTGSEEGRPHLIEGFASSLSANINAIVVQRELLFRKLFVSPNPGELHPGKRNFAARDFGQNQGLIEPGDPQIVIGDSTAPRQPAELSGFFKPAVVLPVRGDWLVELRGFELSAFGRHRGF